MFFLFNPLIEYDFSVNELILEKSSDHLVPEFKKTHIQYLCLFIVWTKILVVNHLET